MVTMMTSCVGNSSVMANFWHEYLTFNIARAVKKDYKTREIVKFVRSAIAYSIFVQSLLLFPKGDSCSWQ